jgi:hypothetical protein
MEKNNFGAVGDSNKTNENNLFGKLRRAVGASLIAVAGTVAPGGANAQYIEDVSHTTSATAGEPSGSYASPDSSDVGYSTSTDRSTDYGYPSTDYASVARMEGGNLIPFIEGISSSINKKFSGVLAKNGFDSVTIWPEKAEDGKIKVSVNFKRIMTTSDSFDEKQSLFDSNARFVLILDEKVAQNKYSLEDELSAGISSKLVGIEKINSGNV